MYQATNVQWSSHYKAKESVVGDSSTPLKQYFDIQDTESMTRDHDEYNL